MSEVSISLNALAAKQQSIVGIPKGNMNQLRDLVTFVAEGKVSICILVGVIEVLHVCIYVHYTAPGHTHEQHTHRHTHACMHNLPWEEKEKCNVWNTEKQTGKKRVFLCLIVLWWLSVQIVTAIIITAVHNPPPPPPKKKGGGGAAHLNLRDRNAFSWAKPRLWSCIHT